MSQGDTFAKQLREAVQEVREAVEGCAPVDWGRPTESEKWPAAALARHIAQGMEPTMASLLAVALDEGGEPELTAEYLSARADRHAAHYGEIRPDEVLALLAENESAALSKLGALSEAQFATTGVLFGETMTAAEVFQGVVLGHMGSHLRSFQATVSAAGVAG